MGSSVTGHSTAALDFNPPSSNGEGDEGNEGDEGHEGNEEEEREQDWQGQDGKGVGAPRLQGQDRRWLDSQGPYQEQAWPRCEQEEERLRKDQPLDRCSQESTRRAEDQGLLCHQEGHTTLRQGKGVLQGMNARGEMTDARACVRHQLRL